jgi:hypothetical protein
VLGWLRLGLVWIDCVSYPTFSMTSVDLIVSRCSLHLPPIKSAPADRIGSRPNLLAQGRSYRLTVDDIDSSRSHRLLPSTSAFSRWHRLQPIALAPGDHIGSQSIPSPHSRSHSFTADDIGSSRRHRLQPITSAHLIAVPIICVCLRCSARYVGLV